MPILEKYLGKAYLWRYIPSRPAATTFTVLFALASIAHSWKVSRTKLWSCTPFVVGGIFEVIGYVARILAYDSTGSMGPFIVQAVFLLLPPVLFAATLYSVYGRVVRSVGGERCSIITPRWTTRVFVIGDIVCLNIQSSGAGLTPKPRLARIGDAIIIAGLGLQVLMFAAFLVCCVVFHIRFCGHLKRAKGVSELPWQSCLGMLYTTSLLIQIRNIFRMVEFAMGSDGYLFSNEWPMYAFDGSLMFAVMVCFFIWYPDQFQAPRDSSMELVDYSITAAPHDPGASPLKYLGRV